MNRKDGLDHEENLQRRILTLRLSDAPLWGADDPTPPTPEATAPPTTSASWSAPLPGSRPQASSLEVPGYEILSELGRGGMGVVYLARDLRLKRLVALKTIRGAVSPVSLARFQTEAEAVARLNHPHIVQIHETGPCRDGEASAYYLALEYAAAGSLDTRLRRQKPTPYESAQLVEILAHAVHAAHQAGIVHRDLKPGNILLANPVEGSSGNTVFGFPKVSDFGLARILNPDSEDTGITGLGMVLGTPNYMAPEQACGDNRAVGPPADVYALGAILYQCLTGKPPFRGETTRDLLMQVCFQTPTPPSKAADDINPELERICLTCLKKSPVDRYGSAAALADELRQFLNDRPAQDAPAPATPKRKRRSHRRWMALPLLLGLFVAVGTAFQWRPRSFVPPPEPLKGLIDVEVTEKDNPRRQLLHLGLHPAARPLRFNDEVRVDAEVNRPAYLYIVWIDTQGTVKPVYPWQEEDWKKRPAQEEPVKQVHLPDKAGDRWPIEAGPAGLETLLLLAREEPLGREVNLENVLADLKPRKMEDELDYASFENGELIRNDTLRGPSLHSMPASNPLVRFNSEIQGRLRRYFPYTRAMTFANRGGDAQK